MERGASSGRVREAYRELAWRLHPDRQESLTPAERSLAERRMREVNEAWGVLGDPDRRADYDRALLEAGAAAASAAPRSHRPPRPTKSPRVAVDDGPDSWAGGRGGWETLGDDELDAAPAPHRWVFQYGIPGLILGILLAIVVFTGAFGMRSPATDDGATTTSDCVLGNTLVSCDDPHDGAIVGLPTAEGECPEGSTRVQLDRGVCVRPGTG